MVINEREILTTGVDLLAHRLQETTLFRLTISGNSMGRLLSPGDRIECESVSASKISFGDIAVYREGKALIAHRVIRKVKNGSGSYFLTRGDSQYQSDPVVAQNRVLGKVMSVIKNDHQKIDLTRPKAISLNRIAGLYGLILHHFMSYSRSISSGRIRPLPFFIPPRRLFILPFHILVFWITR